MTTAKRVNGTAMSMPLGILIGVFASLLVTVGLAAILTWLELSGKIDEAMIGYISMGILMLSTVLGALLSATKIKRRWMLVCCVTGLLFYLVLLGCTVLFFGGVFRGAGVSGIVVLVGSFASGMFGIKRNTGREKRFRKYRPR